MNAAYSIRNLTSLPQPVPHVGSLAARAVVIVDAAIGEDPAVVAAAAEETLEVRPSGAHPDYFAEAQA